MNNILSETSCEDARNAHFEAGHAVIAWLEGLEVEWVSIGLDGDASSWIDVCEPSLSDWSLPPLPKARARTESVIRGLLAGAAAQQRYSFGACNGEFNSTDRSVADEETTRRAVCLASNIGGPATTERLWRDVASTIHRPAVWAAIEAVAAALLLDRELAGSEIEEIARSAMPLFGTTAH